MPKATKSPKKIKALAGLTETNGRDEKRMTLTTLEQVWGRDPSDKYGTLIEADYKSKLDDMTRTDLWRHATKVGLPPHDNLPALKLKLVGEFRKFVSQQSAASSAYTGRNTPNSEIPDHIKKILAD